MKKAMILGESFANLMGDTSSAATYASTMVAINSTLYNNHYNGAFVQECGSRTRDTAVIVGFNNAFDDSDGTRYFFYIPSIYPLYTLYIPSI